MKQLMNIAKSFKKKKRKLNSLFAVGERHLGSLRLATAP